MEYLKMAEKQIQLETSNNEEKFVQALKIIKYNFFIL